jgi:hypothetical protein
MIKGKLTVPTIVMTSMLMSGCGNDLDCASGPTKDTVISLAQKQLQEQASALGKSLPLLLAFVTGGARFEAELDKCKGDQRCNDQVGNRAMEAGTTASYRVDAIRTTAKDTATGALACAADLRIDIPKWGSMTEPMTYRVEKTSDGKSYVTIDYLK